MDQLIITNFNLIFSEVAYIVTSTNLYKIDTPKMTKYPFSVHIYSGYLYGMHQFILIFIWLFWRYHKIY
jgi:hypothetical protein